MAVFGISQNLWTCGRECPVNRPLRRRGGLPGLASRLPCFLLAGPARGLPGVGPTGLLMKAKPLTHRNVFVVNKRKRKNWPSILTLISSIPPRVKSIKFECASMNFYILIRAKILKPVRTLSLMLILKKKIKKKRTSLMM